MIPYTFMTDSDFSQKQSVLFVSSLVISPILLPTIFIHLTAQFGLLSPQRNKKKHESNNCSYTLSAFMSLLGQFLFLQPLFPYHSSVEPQLKVP